MSSQATDLASVIAAVELEGVRLIDALAHTTIQSAGDVGDVDINVTRVARVASRDSPPSRFRVAAALELKMTAKVLGPDPAVTLRAVFELTYRLPEGFTASDETLGRFAEINATFNAWPYWREFVQTTMARMNLPPFTLPVFRLRPPADSTKERGQSAAESKGRRGRRKHEPSRVH
jgi:hypothetical protein